MKTTSLTALFLLTLIVPMFAQSAIESSLKKSGQLRSEGNFNEAVNESDKAIAVQPNGREFVYQPRLSALGDAKQTKITGELAAFFFIRNVYL